MFRINSPHAYSQRTQNSRIYSTKTLTNTLNPRISNIDKLTHWKTEYESMLAGTEKIVSINLWGDSISAGSVAGAYPSDRLKYGCVGRLNRKFAELFGQDLGKGIITSTFQSNSSDYWQVTGNPGTSYNFGFGGNARTLLDNETSFSAKFNGTGLNVYLAGTSGGSWPHGGIADIYIDDVLKTSVDTYRTTNQLITVPIIGLSDGFHTFKIQNQTGTNTVTFLGISEIKGTKGVIFNNMAVAGNDSSSIDKIYALSNMTSNQAVLTFIGFGANDYKTQMPIAMYKTHIQNEITAAKNANSDVILIYPSYHDTVTGDILQEQYVEALYDLAVLNDCCLIDMYSAFENFEGAVSSGFSSGDVHPSLFGHEVLEKIIFNVLTSL